MACAVSTEPARGDDPPEPPVRRSAAGVDFDLDAAWQLAPQVQVRPERFGALLYHFGTRQLSFLKSPALLTVVRGLAGQPTARAACRAANVPDDQLPSYGRALATLAGAQMISRRRPA
jgi:mycofactocin biosynthesis protein MftB